MFIHDNWNIYIIQKNQYANKNEICTLYRVQNE